MTQVERAPEAPPSSSRETRRVFATKMSPWELALHKSLKLVRETIYPDTDKPVTQITEHPVVSALHRYGLTPLRKHLGIKNSIVVTPENVMAISGPQPGQ